MVSLLALSMVDCGFKPPSGQIKDYNIDICCFSAKHAALRRKSKRLVGWNQDNVYKWVVVSMSYYNKNSTKRVGLVQSRLLYHLYER